MLFFEHKYLYRSLSGPVPEEPYAIELGQARTVQSGSDATIITYGLGVQWAEAAAAASGASIEIIDLRTLLPWDETTVFESVRKTNRALVLHEDTLTGGIGAELSARIQEACWQDLDAPVKRVGGLDTAFPFAGALEEQFLASSRLNEALSELLGRKASRLGFGNLQGPDYIGRCISRAHSQPSPSPCCRFITYNARFMPSSRKSTSRRCS